MTREAMINYDCLVPHFIKYNPCYYCKKTTVCKMECIPHIMFVSILADCLEHFYKSDANEQAIAKMLENSKRYGLPIPPQSKTEGKIGRQ